MSTEDTTKHIWENLYMVRVPTLDATSVQFLKAHGTYITGDKRIDRANANSWLTTYLSIAKMVEMFKEGIAISVIYSADTKKIYDAIEAHLLAWKQQLEHGVNIGDAPLDDLIEMDKFAHTVYQYAKHHFTPELVNSLFARRLQDRFRAMPTNLLKPLEEAKPIEQVQDRSTYMSDFLKTRVFGSGRF